jgi:tRNA threonylcarbamoyladenosine biosynthesis protein TsaB
MTGPLLAIDTTLDAASAAVLGADGAVRAWRTLPMARGHAEAVAPLARDVMAEAGVAFSDLRRLAVTTGPGSFTGVRVGLAFQRAMAVALAIPCVGVSTLEALALGQGVAGVRIGAIATSGGLYIAAYRDGVEILAPRRADNGAEAAAILAAAGLVAGAAFGSGAAGLGGGFTVGDPGPPGICGFASLAAAGPPDIVGFAHLAAARDPAAHPPTPLYLRAPDAKLPAS